MPFVKKTSIRVILIALIVFSISACSPANSQKNVSISPGDLDMEQGIQITGNQVTIGLSLGTLAEERWVNERKYFETEAAKYEAKVLTQDANMDEALQYRQVSDFIKSHVDVLVIVAVNENAAADCVSAAKKAGIPVLAYSRMIKNADIDVFIGFDAVAIGETLAKAAMEKVPKGNYMIVNGSPIDNNATSQRKGYYNVLQSAIDSGMIKVVHEAWCDNWSPQKAMEEAAAGLQKNNSKVDAIIVSNDGMAGGIIQTLTEWKLDGRVFVTGTDGDLSAIRRIAAGSQTVTLLYPQKEFAEEGARAAISLANELLPADATGKTDNGLKQVPTIFAKTVLVTRDNLEETIIKPGILTKDDIYK
jgi:D-xylose transport system substrate-binding protein